ncbi:MAG: hypothetical protein NTY09_03765 [bacterium]|nr:hypothetical protein [bacterium]
MVGQDSPCFVNDTVFFPHHIHHCGMHRVAFRFFAFMGPTITVVDGEDLFIVRITGFVATVVNHYRIIIP